MSLSKKIIAGTVVLLILGVVLVVVGVVFVAPAVARKVVNDRFERAEQKLSVQIETDSIETVGLGGVEITNLSVVDPESGRTLVTVGRAGGKASILQLMLGKRVITDLWSHDVSVTITREKDGSFDLANVAKRARSAEPEPEEPEEQPAEQSEGGMLRHFGGTLPEVDVTNVSVAFATADGAQPFPVVSLAVPMLEIEHDDGIAVRTQMKVESLAGSEWSLPSDVDVAAVLTEELVPQALNVKFDRPVEVTGLEPVPYLRAGFDGVELSEEGLVTITDAHLGFRSQPEPFATTKRVSLAVARWALNPRDIVFANLTVDAPRMELSFDKQNASQLGDLDHALRAPRARDVVSHATAFARDIEEARRKAASKEPVDEDDAVDAEGEAGEETEDEEPQAPPTPAADPDEPGMLERLLARVPHEINVRDATIDVIDQRALPVVRRAKNLRLENGELKAVHNVAEATFTVEGGFHALADEQKRGSVKGLVSLGYRSKKLDADVAVDALDLSWFGQIMGPTVAENIRGGTLRAKLDVKPGSGKAVVLDGNASVENLVYYWDRLAEGPIEDFTASYGFTATYDPDGKMPESRLLKNGLWKSFNKPQGPDDPRLHGSLVFTKGAAQMGEAKASVLPAIYGTSALPTRLPARVDLQVDLPETPVQTLFEAIPTAIQGPLAGAEFAGNFAWKLDWEIPPHNAGDMQWVSTPVWNEEEFEIVSIPSAVDPRNLMEGYKLTIEATLEDEDGEEFEWSRTVRVPKAQPISAKYLIENCGVTIEQIDKDWRDAEWPKVPDPRTSFMPRTILDSPQYWLSAAYEARIAQRPWNDGDTITWHEERPHGPYVFVPLHHITQWAPRVVTTTEDGGFFHHPGFLFDAFKESVEDNIEAKRFRRGGSTISMQLVKNAFLDHEKLIARKVREAFLVFLMEHVVKVPKARILEVYLNIIEFGPAIYGIHDAAVHYFGKRPDELTVAEVAWLFSILPSPKQRHVFWDKGEISERWFAKMKRYMDAMVKREKLTAEERDAAALTPPEFWKPNIENGDPVLRPSVLDDTGGFFLPLFGNDDTTPTPTPTPNQRTPTPTPLNKPNPTPQPQPKKKKKGWFWNK